MQKLIFFIIILAVFMQTLNVQSRMNPIEFTVDTLENGLIVIYHIDKSAPVVSTIVHYKVGSRYEDPKMTGFAHFFEHLMFEATDDIPRASMDKYVQEAGGFLNAHTSLDETVYKFTVPANQIKLPLWIESQRMRRLLVDEVGVETQRGVIQEERKQGVENSPYGKFFDMLLSNLFSGSSYAWSPIGSEEHIATATIEQFRAFYNNFYQPSNAVLAVSGDFELEDARKYVDGYFGVIPKAPEPTLLPFNMPPITSEIRMDVPDKLATLPGVFMGYRSPKLGDDDYYTMQLLTQILASGESSRIYSRLVDKEQTAVAASMMNLALQETGALVLYGIAAIGKDYKLVETQIDEEVSRIIKDGVTKEELQKAKNIMETEFIESKKLTLEKAQTLASYQAYFGDPSLINSELERYLAVNIDDIKRVAAQYLGTKNRVVLNFIPSPAN